jgi:glycine dehydrogenase
MISKLTSAVHQTGRRTLATKVFSATDTFHNRHNGPTPNERDEMLEAIGFNTMEELSTSTVPASIRHSFDLKLAESSMTESEATKYLKSMAEKNKVMNNFIGMGYYGTLTPAVIRRCLIEDPSWYTSYTPYQPEISQGRLNM